MAVTAITSVPCCDSIDSSGCPKKISKRANPLTEGPYLPLLTKPTALSILRNQEYRGLAHSIVFVRAIDGSGSSKRYVLGLSVAIIQPRLICDINYARFINDIRSQHPWKCAVTVITFRLHASANESSTHLCNFWKIVVRLESTCLTYAPIVSVSSQSEKQFRNPTS